MVKSHEMDSLLGPVHYSGGQIILKVLSIDVIYSLIWYVDIMQILCIITYFDTYLQSQNVRALRGFGLR